MGDHPTTTKQNETILGIVPNCVYAYLGVGLEPFGDTAFSLPLDGISGSVSPFDTGGLVSHIAPVNTWDSERRRQFLNHFTWPSSELPALLRQYPSDDQPTRSAYLNKLPPQQEGPHALWDAPADLQAAIWSDPLNDGCQAWLWEIRSPEAIAMADNMVAWSCKGSVYLKMLEISAAANSPEDIAFFEKLFARYVPLALSGLVEFLKAQQEAA